MLETNRLEELPDSDDESANTHWLDIVNEKVKGIWFIPDI
jgi:hypothetical protein